MTKTSEIPVLIVGGGAAGTILGLEMARHGVAARVVDRLPGPAVTSRAITVHSRTAELLERVDHRLIERFLARGVRNKGYVLHFVDGAGVRSEIRPGMDFTRVDSRYNYMVIHRQSESEAFIRDYVKQKYGRETEWHTRCVEVAQDDDGAVATLVHSDRGDEREQVRCHYLVACDGANSRTREATGLGRQGQDYKSMVLQNMDVYLADFPDDDEYIHYCAGTDHFVMVARLPGGFYRLLASDRRDAPEQASPEEAFQRTLDKHFDGVRLNEIVWHSRWDHALRLADAYRSGNVFLAGDSAHVHPTTGGQGMNCCMQDAFNLGWKLALVEKGWARPELLDTYEKERRPIAEQVLWAATSLQDVFMGHGRDIAERSRQIFDPDWLEAVVGRCSGISYTYRDYVEQAPGLEALVGPMAGDRAPDCDIGDGATLFGLMRHPGFTLLALAGKDKIDLSSFLQRLGARYGDLVRSAILQATPGMEAAYGRETRGRLYLVRPDGYVGFRCLAREAERLESYLKGLLTL
jgi:2-polyprenyl-6-methoxyphenol hydroxylase-like FAD-dependent oxidoreductase